MKPSDYQCMEAWGKMCGSNYAYVLDQQEIAAKRNAPIDAIYQNSDGTFATLGRVRNNQTLAWFENHHPDLYRQYIHDRPTPPTEPQTKAEAA